MKSSLCEPLIPSSNGYVNRTLPIEKARNIVRTIPASFGISTEFGVVDISRKEANRMIDTCEADRVMLTFSHRDADGLTIILEYPLS